MVIIWNDRFPGFRTNILTFRPNLLAKRKVEDTENRKRKISVFFFYQKERAFYQKEKRSYLTFPAIFIAEYVSKITKNKTMLKISPVAIFFIEIFTPEFLFILRKTMYCYI